MYMNELNDLSELLPAGEMQQWNAPQRFANWKASFLWGFAATFVLFLAAMSLVLVRDGPPPGFRIEFLVMVMMAFWIGALGFAGFAASQPCITVMVGACASVTIVWRYPFGRRMRSVSREEIASISVIDAFDSDGDPYFYARIVLQDGSQVNFGEAHHRPSCVARVRKLKAALDEGN